MVSRAGTIESGAEIVPVHKDPDILAAATRMAGEDLCSIGDLSSGEVRAILSFAYPLRARKPASHTAEEWSSGANRKPLSELVREVS